jgi:predicted GH43/DUF377 family glycosyl hydrolase
MKNILISYSIVFIAIIGSLQPATAAVTGRLALDLGQQGWESALVWRPTVVYSGSSFMMWYSGEANNGIDNIGLATSGDGVSWARYAQNPVLKIRALSWDSGSVQEPWVIYENGEYKMWYTGQQLTTQSITVQSIGYATSPDGIQWTKYSDNPVLTAGKSGDWDDKWVYRPVVVSTGSKYMMYYSGRSNAGTTGTQVGVALSNDGIHWDKQGPASAFSKLTLSRSGWDSYSQFLGGVLKTGAGYMLAYYGSSATNDPYQIGLASSSDGISWFPYPDNPAITYGSSGSWNDGGVRHPVLIAVGDKYYVYYSVDKRNDGTRIGVTILPSSQYTISFSTIASSSLTSTIATTAASSQPITSTTSESTVALGTGGVSSNLLILAVVIAVIVVAGAVFLMRRRPAGPKVREVTAPMIELRRGPPPRMEVPKVTEAPPAPGKGFKHCIHCGATIPAVVMFCTKCGKKQE